MPKLLPVPARVVGEAREGYDTFRQIAAVMIPNELCPAQNPAPMPPVVAGADAAGFGDRDVRAKEELNFYLTIY